MSPSLPFLSFVFRLLFRANESGAGGMVLYVEGTKGGKDVVFVGEIMFSIFHSSSKISCVRVVEGGEKRSERRK